MAARRNRGAAAETEPDADAVLDGELELAQTPDSDEELERFLDGFADEEATVSVYRKAERGRRNAFLFTRSVREVTMPEILEALRDDYGGGSFRLDIRSAEGRYVAAKAVEVEAPKRPLPGREAEQRERERDVIQVHAGGELGGVLELMERSHQQHRELVNSLLSAMRPPERSSFTELAEGLAALQALQPKPGGTNLKEFLEVYQLIESIKGDGGGGSTGWDLMRSAVNAFVPMIAGQVAGGGGLPQLGFAPTAALEQPPPAQPALEQPPQQPAAAAAPPPIEAQLELLLRAAGEDRDPETYAELALDELGPELAAGVFVDPAGWQAFCARVPAAADPRLASWFAEFRAILAQLLQEGGDGDVPVPGGSDPDPRHTDGPAGGGGGGAPDPGDHGAPREPGEG